MSWGAIAAGVRFGDRAALDDVSLEAPGGSVTAVVGGDGAGKTTLLRLLAGALAPDRGEVHRPAAARIGYLPASSGTYPDLSVQENLAFVATAYGLSGAQAAQRAAEHLQRTGLAGVGNRLAGDLSGGMRQKLGVIAAMLHRPDLLVLDEPTTGVDPVSRRDLWWLIARAAAGGAAVVLATSYVDEAERAQAVTVLDGGQVIAAGTPEQIVSQMTGRLFVTAEAPAGADGARAWRRGRSWRVWRRDGTSPAGPTAEPARADLEDAVIVAALAREPDPVGPVGPADAGSPG
jgi:ABC-2 type transport system ATP-binding protein